MAPIGLLLCSTLSIRIHLLKRRREEIQNAPIVALQRWKINGGANLLTNSAFKLDHAEQRRATARADRICRRHCEGAVSYLRGHPPNIGRSGVALDHPGSTSAGLVRAEP